MALLFRGILVGVIGFVIWKVLQPRCVIRIVVTQDGVTSHSGIPAARQSDTLNWLARQVITDRKVTISVYQSRDGRPQIRFSGPIADDTQQLVRNYLLSELT